jgi:hypothetical protein
LSNREKQRRHREKVRAERIEKARRWYEENGWSGLEIGDLSGLPVAELQAPQGSKG